MTAYTPKEAIAIYSARLLKEFDGKSAIIGIGMPVLATLLAKRLYCPRLSASIESGSFDVDIKEIPFSLFGARLTYGCSAQLDNLAVLSAAVRGKVDVGFLGGAQIDRYGNLNSTAIGDYLTSTDRLAGTGGAIDIGCYAMHTITVMAHEKRRLVEQVDYLTTPGWYVKNWPDGNMVHRGQVGLPGGPYAVVTNLGIMKFAAGGEMYLDQYFPGVSVEQIQEHTGFDLNVSGATEAEPITEEELHVLRLQVDPLNLYGTR